MSIFKIGNFLKFLLVIILILAGVFIWQKTKKKTEKEFSLPASLKETTMRISSPSFEDNSKIPIKYTCDGDDINPPLEIKNIPEKTQSLVLIVNDPDAPGGNFLHWLLLNLPADTSFIKEGILPQGVIEGKNDFGKIGYGGPCPPFGTHRYFFKIFALDNKLDLPTGFELKDVEKAMEGHILDQAQLVGLYQRK